MEGRGGGAVALFRVRGRICGGTPQPLLPRDVALGADPTPRGERSFHSPGWVGRAWSAAEIYPNENLATNPERTGGAGLGVGGGGVLFSADVSRAALCG